MWSLVWFGDRPIPPCSAHVLFHKLLSKNLMCSCYSIGGVWHDLKTVLYCLSLGIWFGKLSINNKGLASSGCGVWFGLATARRRPVLPEPGALLSGLPLPVPGPGLCPLPED